MGTGQLDGVCPVSERFESIQQPAVSRLSESFLLELEMTFLEVLAG